MGIQQDDHYFISAFHGANLVVAIFVGTVTNLHILMFDLIQKITHNKDGIYVHVCNFIAN